MDAMTEAKRAGRTATFLGGFWCTGLLALYFINTQLLNQRRFLLLPVFSLLALYLVIGGAIQWKTGRGGNQIQSDTAYAAGHSHGPSNPIYYPGRSSVLEHGRLGQVSPAAR